jgi:small-conductance mechanosensitive channel
MPSRRAALVLAVLSLLAPAAPARAQAAPGAAAGSGNPAVLEEGRPGAIPAEQAAAVQALAPAPVYFDGRLLFLVRGGIPGLTPRDRAANIEARLRAVAGAPEPPGPVRVVEAGFSDIFAGDSFLVSITDAESGGRQNRALYAQAIARTIEEALRGYREARTPDALVRSGVKVAVATAVLVVLLLALRFLRLRVGPALRRRGEALLARARIQGLELIRPEAQARLVRGTGWAVHALLILVSLLAWLELVLHFLPWTRGAADRWLGFVFGAVIDVLRGVVGYLPNLVYITLFALLGYGAHQLNRLFFRAVAAGAVRLPGFHADWSAVTSKIVSLFLFALVGVAVYPYLPGSGSSAFQAIGIFLGAVISLGSGSSVANAIAGVVITYMRPFAVGDFVRIADATGTVTEQSSLAIRLLTIRNEHVTLPAAIVLANPIVNYSAQVRSSGVAIRTGVTIGYDTPWRQVHELLLAAAGRTSHVLASPPPWVIQTELHDFYVRYELDAYIDDPARQHFILSELNQNVQDSFFAAGVEILSPHYASLRDGNAPAIPEGQAPPGTPPRSFQVALRRGGPGKPGTGQG